MKLQYKPMKKSVYYSVENLVFVDVMDSVDYGSVWETVHDPVFNPVEIMRNKNETTL